MPKKVETIDIYIPELEATPDKVPRRPWSDWEIGVLKKYYGSKPPGAIGKVLNRSIHAVQEKARILGIRAYQKEVDP